MAMDREAFLDELRVLLNIPQFQSLLFHKVNELKLYLKDEVDHYIALKNKYCRTVYSAEVKSENGNDNISVERKMYHFELSWFEDRKWVISDIEPSPPPEVHSQAIVPWEAVKFMSAHETNLSQTVNEPRFLIPGKPGKAYQLTFTKYYDDLILGVIAAYSISGNEDDGTEESMGLWPEQFDEAEYEAQNEAHGDKPGPQLEPPVSDDEEKYRQLFYYMQKYPAIKNYIFNELDTKLKPLVKADIIKLPSKNYSPDGF